jgi:hypothetical protein
MLRAADERFPNGYRLAGSSPRQTVNVRGGVGVGVGVEDMGMDVGVGVEIPFGPQAAKRTTRKTRKPSKTDRRSGITISLEKVHEHNYGNLQGYYYTTTCDARFVDIPIP